MLTDRVEAYLTSDTAMEQQTHKVILLPIAILARTDTTMVVEVDRVVHEEIGVKTHTQVVVILRIQIMPHLVVRMAEAAVDREAMALRAAVEVDRVVFVLFGV